MDTKQCKDWQDKQQLAIKGIGITSRTFYDVTTKTQKTSRVVVFKVQNGKNIEYHTANENTTPFTQAMSHLEDIGIELENGKSVPLDETVHISLIQSHKTAYKYPSIDEWASQFEPEELFSD